MKLSRKLPRSVNIGHVWVVLIRTRWIITVEMLIKLLQLVRAERRELQCLPPHAPCLPIIEPSVQNLTRHRWDRCCSNVTFGLC